MLLPAIVLAAEAAALVAITAYLAMILSLHRDALRTPEPRRDPASRALLASVRIAFSIGIAALFAHALWQLAGHAGLV